MVECIFVSGNVPIVQVTNLDIKPKTNQTLHPYVRMDLEADSEPFLVGIIRVGGFCPFHIFGRSIQRSPILTWPHRY